MSAKADNLMQRFGANISQTVAQRPSTPQGTPPAGQADKYAGAFRVRAFAELPVDAVLADPQPRTEFDAEDLDRLAASIKRFGQLAPIRVRHDPARDAWVVLVGERRLRACKLAGLERVRVEFVEREMTEADVLAEQVVENAVRADLQPVEAGRAYKRLMDLNGWTAQQVGETLGIEATAVYRALSLLKLPEDVADQVDAGEIKATAAYEISKLQIADEQRELARKVVEEGLDHKATVAEVRRRQKSRDVPSLAARRRLPAEQRHRGTRGVRVTIQVDRQAHDGRRRCGPPRDRRPARAERSRRRGGLKVAYESKSGRDGQGVAMGGRKRDTGKKPGQARRPVAPRKGAEPGDRSVKTKGRDVDFSVELATYDEHLPELLGSEGKFVLILGSAVDGPFDTYEKALDAGYEKYDLKPFLVKQIRAAEPIQYFTRDLR